MSSWDMDWLFKMFEKGLFKLGDAAGDALANAGENTGEHASPGRIKDKIATARMMRGGPAHMTQDIYGKKFFPTPSESMSRTLKDLERQAFTVFWGMIRLSH